MVSGSENRREKHPGDPFGKEDRRESENTRMPTLYSPHLSIPPSPFPPALTLSFFATRHLYPPFFFTHLCFPFSFFSSLSGYSPRFLRRPCASQTKNVIIGKIPPFNLIEKLPEYSSQKHFAYHHRFIVGPAHKHSKRQSGHTKRVASCPKT